ncbi:MAG: response regulator [Planctomycetes bacterium]|nr:response regulator [Planctomycetota bacterium]
MTMQKQIGQAKVLVLWKSAPDNIDPDWLNLLRKSFELTIVDSVVEALALLSRDSFDAVFSQTADFLPLERAAVSDQAVAILNTIGEGVCLVGKEGLVLWKNKKMEGFDPLLSENVADRSQQAYSEFEKQIASGVAEQKLRHRKSSFTLPQTDRYFEMVSTPMLDVHGTLSRVATVVFEATAGRKLQQRIDAIDKAGRELVHLDAEALSAMNTEQRINLIQDKIIRSAKDLLHFDHFVVRLLHRPTNKLEVLFGVGLPPEAHQLEIFANSQNNGITGYVVDTGRTYICNNPDSDPRYLAGLPDVKSTLTVPLMIYDKVIGALNVESHHEQAFGEEDRQVAEIFARYIAISLNILNLLVFERFQTAGQAADSLNRETSEPLRDIMITTTMLMEDYIGHDDLRHRLQAIIDNVTSIKTALKDSNAAPKGIFGAHKKGPLTLDPNLADKLVLIADDEPFIRDTISDVVQKFGMLTDIACDGREAISLIAQRHYDLIISDIKLPFASGYEVFDAAQKTHRAIPVILMTGFGYDPNHSIVRANREGLAAVLYKPFKIDQLMTEIRQALDLHQKK